MRKIVVVIVVINFYWLKNLIIHTGSFSFNSLLAIKMPPVECMKLLVISQCMDPGKHGIKANIYPIDVRKSLRNCDVSADSKVAKLPPFAAHLCWDPVNVSAMVSAQ